MSDKSLAENLRIKPGTTPWLSDPARLPLIEPLPQGVTLAEGPGSASAALRFRPPKPVEAPFLGGG